MRERAPFAVRCSQQWSATELHRGAPSPLEKSRVGIELSARFRAIYLLCGNKNLTLFAFSDVPVRALEIHWSASVPSGMNRKRWRNGTKRGGCHGRGGRCGLCSPRRSTTFSDHGRRASVAAAAGGDRHHRKRAARGEGRTGLRSNGSRGGRSSSRRATSSTSC